MTNTYESVRNAHNTRPSVSNDKATTREAYNYDVQRESPRKNDEPTVDKLHLYATTSIDREESTPMRCATFDALDYACKKIARTEKISETKIYPALRWIGYDRRYSNMKRGNPDALCDIGDVADMCMDSDDPGIVPFVYSSNGLFANVDVIQYRVSTISYEIAKKDAAKAGIKLSELNLFNALEGLDVLVNESPTYFLLRENIYIDESLTKFDFIKRHLTAKRNTMSKLLGN